MTFKQFEDGEIFTASDARLLMAQGIISVANVTEQNAIPAPADGTVIYRRDLSVYLRRSGSSWRTFDDYVVVANAAARDALPKHEGLTVFLRSTQLEERYIGTAWIPNGERYYGGIKGAIPNQGQILVKRGFATATRDSNGVYMFTYPEAFPTEIAGFDALTIEGAGVQPVVNGANITRQAASLIWPGAGAGTCKFNWTAWGY